MKMKIIAIAAVVAVVGSLVSACGSIYENEPVGIGRDVSELKRSPCACLQLKLPGSLPDWMSNNG